VLDQDFEDDAQTLILRLPESDRAILLDRVVGMLPWKEIAIKRDMTEDAAKKRGERARKRLVEQYVRLRADYADRDEPDPEHWPPPIRRTTRADVERYIRDMESSGIRLTAAERAEMLDGAPPDSAEYD
jgi:hypothetical protein